LNYSQTQISNLALNRIGARGQITSVNENSPNAVKVLTVWDHVFKSVLSERDWKFAKIRAILQLPPSCNFTGSISGNGLSVSSITSGAIQIGQSLLGNGIQQNTQVTAGVGSSWTVSVSQTVASEGMVAGVWPLYGYKFAWAMPADFLRFVRPHKRPPDRNWAWMWGPEGEGFYHRANPPFWPAGEPYIVETLPIDGNKYAQTNYGGWCGPAKINYIRLITDLTQLMPGFVECLVFRLAQELAISVTESQTKFDSMAEKYKDSLNSAEAQNESSDFEHDEAGSDSWVRAGRCIEGGWGSGAGGF
jgi:hypothetical protein